MSIEPHLNPVSAYRRPVMPIRSSTPNRLPWSPTRASAELQVGQAKYYLIKKFDYREQSLIDEPMMILAKVVCNLRNYFLQSQESTVRLIQQYFNPKSDYKWSEEGIRLTWELVESFTPALGLADKQVQARHRAAILENEVVDLIAWTQPGGRVSGSDLLKVFQEWNPELEITFTSNTFSRAVTAVTGMRKKPLNGIYYWVGFHLPSSMELGSLEEDAA